METSESVALQTARWSALGSSATILLGIAPSQILLGLALLALFISREKLRVPPIWLPLGLFLAGTLLALAFSDNPAAGFPQVKKFYVFTQLVIVFSLLRGTKYLRWLFWSWAALGSLSAIYGFIQFAGKVQQAHAAGADVYAFYVGERITGFMSHWYTFSAQEMFVLIMLASFLFFGPIVKKQLWIWLVLGVLCSAGLLLAETRGVWLASAAAALYLIWFWRRWLVALVPVAILAALLVAPGVIRNRVTSILSPTALDSNQFRIVAWRAGIEMIEKHPLLGIGPEMPGVEFKEYIPADIPRPLPIGAYIHLHNLYLQYAAERGIPTLLMLLWLMGKVLVDFWRGLRALPPGRSDRRFLLHGGIAAVLATLVDGVANLNLGISPVLTMFLVVIAAGYLALDKQEVPEEQLPAAA